MLLAFTKDQQSGERWHRAAPLSLHATGKGEHRMRYIHHLPFIVVLSLVVRIMPISLAVSAPAVPPSSASSGPLDDPSTPLRGQGRHGPIVTLRVRALVPEKVKLSDPAQGTVPATVLAVDEAINQITVQTDEGQQLMLFLDPASLARLHVGAPCLLQVANGSTRDTSRPPEHEGAFW
jgi:hypothetical protein